MIAARVNTYVHKHDDDGIDHNDTCGAPKEYSVLRSDVSYLSGEGNAAAANAARSYLPWSEVETPCNRVPGKTVSLLQAPVDR